MLQNGCHYQQRATRCEDGWREEALYLLSSFTLLLPDLKGQHFLIYILYADTFDYLPILYNRGQLNIVWVVYSTDKWHLSLCPQQSELTTEHTEGTQNGPLLLRKALALQTL